MIISTNLKTIFIKGRKVGGTSVEIALSAYCNDKDVVTPITQVDEKLRLSLGYGGARNYAKSKDEEDRYLNSVRNADTQNLSGVLIPNSIYYNHMALTEVIELKGKEVEGYEIIGVERSPYSKILSLANMRATFARYQRGGRMLPLDISELRHGARELVETNALRQVLNVDLYKDASGNLAVRLLRFSNLHSELMAFVRSRGVEPVGDLPHAKRGVNADSLQPTEFFSRTHLDRINDIFAEEFERFGYEKI